MQRRRFLLQQLIAAAAAAVNPLASAVGGATPRYLRPPGALPRGEFEQRCIGCSQCAAICPNRCIQYFGTENGLSSLNTPYIIPREKACILCMKCGTICPTDALTPIPRKLDAILTGVDMGRARVDKNLCLSYQGKTCGVCYRACPLPDVAIKVGMLEQPTVNEACVGCGLCERSCIQIPHAIRIVPHYG